ncbi:hypothetical protein KSP40_PGU012457 [Platanthera guangdongensis]|uniref:RING-CH-type domain-containing protein n=1 Tax=Platanthera guangdongensis TaxID=2320717 RepID=A0ABR2MSB9_9ASPA
MEFESFEESRLSADGSKSIPPLPSSSSLRLCRICHEEEEQDTTTMETPCACSGTLKVIRTPSNSVKYIIWN